MTLTPEEFRQTAKALMALADDPKRQDIQHSCVGEENWINTGNLSAVQLGILKLRLRPKPKLIPFTQETWPKGEVWVKDKEQLWEAHVSELRINGVCFGRDYYMQYEELVNQKLISTDGRRTYGPCGQEVKE